MPGVSELAREEEEALYLDTAVEEFSTAFDTSTDPALWQRLVDEEEKEVAEAAANFLKECIDLGYVSMGYERLTGELPRTGRLPSWVGDMWEAVPPKVALEALRRVHASNMSKLGDDGKPVRREDGKVLKGPNYKPADLSDLTYRT